MGGTEEFARLFADLAIAIRRPLAGVGNEEAAGAVAPLLAERLNPSPDAEASGTRVLDAVLSLMCFKTREVYGSSVDCIVKTLVSVLSSSVYCEVLSGGEGGKRSAEIFRIGSCICLADTEKLIRSCIDDLGMLKEHALYRPLLRAVLKVAVSASDIQSLYRISASYYENHETPRICSAVTEMHSQLPEETSDDLNEIPLRSLLWYLAPSLLKEETSNLLREAINRPFLRLKDEFQGRMKWRILLLSLATNPTVFTQARALLHNWFLMTGLAAVIDLQTALVSSLFDVLSMPMKWGLSMEMGLKLPFLRAYFPTRQAELLAALTKPISGDGLLPLVKLVEAQNDRSTPRIDCNSTWAMLMNFPSWFYSAASLIFAGEKSTLQEAASRYLSLVLSPLDEGSFIHCCRLLGEVSQSWAQKKLRKRKVSAAEGEGSRVEIWLRKFHECYEEFCIRAAAEESQREMRTMEIVDPRASQLFRRVPLGLLISHASLLEERDFGLLLHYAATGEIIPLRKKREKTWPIRGAALVFSLFDHVEDEGMFSVDVMKGKSAGYLMQCIREILQARTWREDGGEEREMMWKDLSARLAQWREHGVSGDVLDDINRM